MKNLKSELFKKFEGAELSDASLELTQGGDNSNGTGDNQCTGPTSDCTDADTTRFEDDVLTRKEYDTER